MSYLIPRDYAKQIQAENLSQIIGSDDGVLSMAELTAVEEAKSYLVQKYDCGQEFKDLFEWDKTKIYNPTDRVYMNPDAYSVSATYAAGDYVLQGGKVYKSKAGNAAHAFAESEWDYVCDRYQVFNAVYPQPLFSYTAQYRIGDVVYWNGRIYTCAIPSPSYSQSQMIQFVNYSSVPYNVAPDNINNGLQYWGTGTAYNVPANTDMLNTDFWSMGDNRSQQLVTTVLDICLYHVHSRISPRNIPDLRVKRYDDAVKWLKKAATGEITAALPVLQPKQGGRIRYGGNIKNMNSY